MRFLKSLPVLLMLVTSSALAQTPSANQVIGEVTDINNELRQISLGPDKGEPLLVAVTDATVFRHQQRSEEHTSELQSHLNLVCRLLLEKKNPRTTRVHTRKP